LGLFTGGLTAAVTSVTIDAGTSPQNPAINIGVASGLSAVAFRLLNNNSTSGFIALSAEL
jgi:hypothetical protein